MMMNSCKTATWHACCAMRQTVGGSEVGDPSGRDLQGKHYPCGNMGAVATELQLNGHLATVGRKSGILSQIRRGSSRTAQSWITHTYINWEDRCSSISSCVPGVGPVHSTATGRSAHLKRIGTFDRSRRNHLRRAHSVTPGRRARCRAKLDRTDATAPASAAPARKASRCARPHAVCERC